MRRRHESLGFTLVELLVVIAIIGILSAVVLASMGGARSKGRDAKRIADLKQLQLALQLAYDANSSYPSASGDIATALTTLTTSNYMSTLPTDPLSSGGGYYAYIPLPASCANSSPSSCSDYVLAAKLENDSAGLDGYKKSPGQGGPAAFTVSGSANEDCSKTGTPDFIYCVKP